MLESYLSRSAMEGCGRWQWRWLSGYVRIPGIPEASPAPLSLAATASPNLSLRILPDTQESVKRPETRKRIAVLTCEIRLLCFPCLLRLLEVCCKNSIHQHQQTATSQAGKIICQISLRWKLTEPSLCCIAAFPLLAPVRWEAPDITIIWREWPFHAVFNTWLFLGGMATRKSDHHCSRLHFWTTLAAVSPLCALLWLTGFLSEGSVRLPYEIRKLNNTAPL